MSKQERIAECEEIFKFYENKHSNPSYGFDQVTWDRLCFWRKELEAAQAMPDDTAQVSDAETFLLDETDKLDIECYIRQHPLSASSAIAYLDVDKWKAPKLEATLYGNGQFGISIPLFHTNSITDFADFIALQKAAGEIALKWQAHVSHLEGLVAAKNEFGRSASLIKAIKAYQSITRLRVAESKKAVKTMLAAGFVSEDN